MIKIKNIKIEQRKKKLFKGSYQISNFDLKLIIYSKNFEFKILDFIKFLVFLSKKKIKKIYFIILTNDLFKNISSSFLKKKFYNLI
jgi:putative ribosome biogenesis GTPase RsgA